MIKARLAVLGLLVSLLWPQSAAAMVVGNPTGTLINGWFKDQFSVVLQYGDGMCKFDGTVNSFTYTAGAAQEGVHDYHFSADRRDNPYLAIDQGLFFPLITPPPCLASVPSVVRDLNAIAIDASPPTVNLTIPSKNVSTDQSSYSVGGNASDSSSGVKAVRIFINGVAGPFANISGGTYSANISLNMGDNIVTAIAYDVVDHQAQSNGVVITRTNPSSGGNSPVPGNTGTGSNSSNSSSANTATGQASLLPESEPGEPRVAKLFSPDLPKLKQASSGSAQAEKPADLGIKGVGALVLMMVLLLGATGGYIWLAPRLPGRQGLRRKIIMTVILPAIVPLVALGIAGYQQLTESVKSSLSEQLSKAAEVTALKLEREFDIRKTVLISTASNIIQIKNYYNEERATLARQRDSCQEAARNLIPKNKPDAVISSPDCAPFLAGFARLSGAGSNSLNIYLTAIGGGYDRALAALNRSDAERTDQSLVQLKLYFPETLDVAVVDNSAGARVLAALPTPDGKHLLNDHADLLAQAGQVDLNSLINGESTRHLIMGYPVSSQGNKLGAVVVAYNLDDNNFIRPTWQGTPKPHNDDSVLIVDDAGQLIYPKAALNQSATAELKKAAAKPAGMTSAIRLGNQDFTARLSPVGGTNWTVLVGAPAGSVLKPLVGVQLTALVAIAISILLALLLGYVFASAITRQLSKLTVGAQKFAAGNLDHQIQVKSHDELETLAENMNQMSVKIKAAEEALIEKDKEFIYVATHELRAPLTAVLGNLSMLADNSIGKVDKPAMEVIDQAYNSSQRLRELINDMLDLARLDAGKTEFESTSLDARKITEDVVKMQAVVAKEQKIKLTFEADKKIPPVKADESKLKSIVTNLVSNAIKYNKPGGIIKVSQVVERGEIVTTVADTGLGIPKDQQGHMFEKFFRVKGNDRSEITGTGLGMHITKRFVEGMGGKIGFESVAGHGTTFTFSLPLAKPVKLPTKP